MPENLTLTAIKDALRAKGGERGLIYAPGAGQGEGKNTPLLTSPSALVSRFARNAPFM